MEWRIDSRINWRPHKERKKAAAAVIKAHFYLYKILECLDYTPSADSTIILRMRYNYQWTCETPREVMRKRSIIESGIKPLDDTFSMVRFAHDTGMNSNQIKKNQMIYSTYTLMHTTT